MSNLQPKQIIDSTGRHTTVHVNPDKNNSATAARVGSVSAPVSAVAVVGAVEPYKLDRGTGVSPTDGFRFDFRDINYYLDDLVTDLEEHLESYGLDDDSTFAFSEGDQSFGEFERYKNEISQYAGGLRQIKGVSFENDPQTDSVREWIEYGARVGEKWDSMSSAGIGNALISEDKAADLYIRDFKKSDEYKSLPSHIAKSIDWDKVSQELSKQPSVVINDSLFYFTEIDYITGNLR